MKCNDFDTHIDEMLSGILHPDANQHLRQCERCTSHLRSRASVQNGLRKLASATASGPSRATDRAVMESYRRLQQRRAAAWKSEPVADSAATARLFTLPARNHSSVLASPTWSPRTWVSRTWLSGAAAAALVFAVLGSAVHLWTGVPTVSAPVVATAPSAPATEQITPIPAPRQSKVATNSASRTSQRAGSRSGLLSTQLSARSSQSSAFRSAPPEAPVLAAKTATARPPVVSGGTSNYDSVPVTQVSAKAAPVIRLATSGASGNVAQSASSTWPGYSNLMYCDPVVCSGPMQVVHIKVPVGQVKPNLGQTTGNAFVNAEVVVGPDGVARAIRVAN